MLSRRAGLSAIAGLSCCYCQEIHYWRSESYKMNQFVILAHRTNGLAYATALRLSVVRPSVIRL